MTTDVTQRRPRTTSPLLRQVPVSDLPNFDDETVRIDEPAQQPEPDHWITPTAVPMPSVLRRGLLAAAQRKPRITRLPEVPPADYRFALLQQWEGVVQEVTGDEFSAVVRDLTDPNHAEEEAVLAIQEVTPDDLPLLAPGAIFYWSIGYRTSRVGQVDRVSTIRFRRLPAWSRLDLQRRDQRATALMERFGR
jgi:hypothetical protein